MQDYRKKELFDNELMDKIRNNITETEYLKLKECLQKMTYTNIHNIIIKELNNKCIQKKTYKLLKH